MQNRWLWIRTYQSSLGSRRCLKFERKNSDYQHPRHFEERRISFASNESGGSSSGEVAWSQEGTDPRPSAPSASNSHPLSPWERAASPASNSSPPQRQRSKTINKNKNGNLFQSTVTYRMWYAIYSFFSLMWSLYNAQCTCIENPYRVLFNVGKHLQIQSA